MANILCKIPTRSRVDAFIETFDSFHGRQSNDHIIHYMISIDDDDDEMQKWADTYSHGLRKANAHVISAPRAGKIGSVNRDMEHAPDDYDIVMQPSDDFICLVDGWDKRVVEELEAFDEYDGVAWFYDGHQPNIDTMCILGRKYYERFNYIYYPEYRTFWADNEFTEVADRLDRLVFSREVLFEHRHPDWTHSHGYSGQKQGYDELYLENDKPEDREWDDKLFHDRKARNFDLES